MPRRPAGATTRPDEIGQMARVFPRMAREVAAREQHLRNEVRQLQVEIDLAKQARAVASITETDYFRALQKRAQTLRARKGEEP